jgi:hypothetical protein
MGLKAPPEGPAGGEGEEKPEIGAAGAQRQRQRSDAVTESRGGGWCACAKPVTDNWSSIPRMQRQH